MGERTSMGRVITREIQNLLWKSLIIISW